MRDKVRTSEPRHKVGSTTRDNEEIHHDRTRASRATRCTDKLCRASQSQRASQSLLPRAPKRQQNRLHWLHTTSSSLFPPLYHRRITKQATSSTSSLPSSPLASIPHSGHPRGIARRSIESTSLTLSSFIGLESRDAHRVASICESGRKGRGTSAERERGGEEGRKGMKEGEGERTKM